MAPCRVSLSFRREATTQDLVPREFHSHAILVAPGHLARKVSQPRPGEKPIKIRKKGVKKMGSSKWQVFLISIWFHWWDHEKKIFKHLHTSRYVCPVFAHVCCWSSDFPQIVCFVREVLPDFASDQNPQAFEQCQVTCGWKSASLKGVPENRRPLRYPSVFTPCGNIGIGKPTRRRHIEFLCKIIYPYKII